MTDKLNILILYKMGDPRQWRTAVRDLEFMLPTSAPNHNYIVHPSERPLPPFIKDIDFHGIILGPTFLCNRYRHDHLAKTLVNYDFIRQSDAFKIAMPQDDYDCSAILDRWMTNWNVDIVYSVCDNNWQTLYPLFSKVGQIKLGYTGYITDTWIDSWNNPKPFVLRSIDISYRASKLPPYYGSIGHIKSVIGDRFKSKLKNDAFKLDISTDPSDFIPGDKWHSFLENSKFCLVSNSGSSLHDPEGEIRASVNRFLSSNANATFEEVLKNCFPDEDCKYVFTAISPRNIEAALSETIQIATPGAYSNILEADRDYIPLDPNCSNITAVVDKMKNHQMTKSIAKRCKQSVLSVDALRANNQAAKMIQQIEAGISAKNIIGTKHEKMKKNISRYHDKFIAHTEQYWKKRRFLQKYRTLLSRAVNELFSQ